jgi:sulfur-carrier protein
MPVELLFFAALRDCIGKAQQEIHLPHEVRDVAALKQWLEATYPVLQTRLSSVRIAVNEEFAADDRALHAGDVVALIPPVCGG